ncbi:hypothetical protein GGH94_002411 [Coemansia aciculifera]|uniref:Cell death regulator Aven n=2 Tax=Coemansia TaxID=4863 RepID=A0A9W8ISE9_9FUNG|nr:hypothetical protein GGH94_002411 [Coemansia aciculifera]KAJ2874886.1 hypothetical protein GGH93_002077 [Coemansia aciculifera]
MRPDPHKQKASRRYQAKHKTATLVSTQDAGQGISAESASRTEHNTYSEDLLDTNENAEAREEEDVNEFLKYLKDESQHVSTEQSAVYFQLRTETESAELGTHNEGVWKKLLDVDWDSSLKNVTTSTTLQELLDTDHEFAPDNELREGEDVTLEDKPAIQSAQVRSITRQLNVVELAPNAKSPAPKQPAVVPPVAANKQSNAKDTQPVDDLEAFLDDLL